MDYNACLVFYAAKREIRLPLKMKVNRKPATNPPTWAMNATPPVSAAVVIEPILLKSCRMNQNPITIRAGTGITRAPCNTLTLMRGNSKMYAPSTPAIAPEAPRLGMLEAEVIANWAAIAARPESR